jgi:hypothetical protein
MGDPTCRSGELTWVALIVFTAQLVLSFGHVHAYGHPHPTNVNLSAAIDDQGAPGQPEHLNGSCALCWLTRATGTLVMPELISLPVRMAIWEPPAPAPGLPVPHSARPSAFQARAPPGANL